MANWLVSFFHYVCTYSILCTLEPAMGPTIYWGRLLIMKFQFAGARTEIYNFWCHCFLWFLPLPNIIIAFAFALILAYDVACDVNCIINIIVQSELLLIACEVIDMFSLILGFWSFSMIIAYDISSYTVGSEHTPYPQRKRCQTLCLSMMTFAFPVSFSLQLCPHLI